MCPPDHVMRGEPILVLFSEARISSMFFCFQKVNMISVIEFNSEFESDYVFQTSKTAKRPIYSLGSQKISTEISPQKNDDVTMPHVTAPIVTSSFWSFSIGKMERWFEPQSHLRNGSNHLFIFPMLIHHFSLLFFDWCANDLLIENQEK